MIPTKSIKAIKSKVHSLKKRIKRNKASVPLDFQACMKSKAFLNWWKEDEKQRFKIALLEHKTDFDKISLQVGTRTEK